jgi:hypothetical protein
MFLLTLKHLSFKYLLLNTKVTKCSTKAYKDLLGQKLIRIILKKQISKLRVTLDITNFIIFAPQSYGRLTEWLGSGLQNRLRRFESATDLNLKSDIVDYQ